MLIRQLDRHFNGTAVFYLAADHPDALDAIRRAFPPGKVITYGGPFCSDSGPVQILTDRHTECMRRALVEQRVLGSIGATMIVTSTFTTFSEVAVRLSALDPSRVMHGCGRHSPVLPGRRLLHETSVSDLSAECERGVCVVALSLYGSDLRCAKKESNAVLFSRFLLSHARPLQIRARRSRHRQRYEVGAGVPSLAAARLSPCRRRRH